MSLVESSDGRPFTMSFSLLRSTLTSGSLLHIQSALAACPLEDLPHYIFLCSAKRDAWT